MDERLRRAQINHGGAKYLVIKEPYFRIQGVYDQLIPGQALCSCGMALVDEKRKRAARSVGFSRIYGLSSICRLVGSLLSRQQVSEKLFVMLSAPLQELPQERVKVRCERSAVGVGIKVIMRLGLLALVRRSPFFSCDRIVSRSTITHGDLC
jgi:hypothetical protein